MTLIKSGKAWKFSTESAVEEIIWRNLPELLKAEPLKRQFSINGQFCDILAVDNSDQLVIIELKNKEDRYVIQQLTRYYDAVKTAADFSLAVDLKKPIRLIAIAPSFHTDTFIDCKYSTLSIELLTFRIDTSPNQLSLVINDDKTGNIIKSLLLPQTLNNAQPNIQISETPRKLLNWLSTSKNIQHEWVLSLRKQLLGFDPRMKEIIEPTRILYGKGKSKPCCELKYHKSDKYLGIYLWLPDPENKPHVLKMLVSFDLEKQKVNWIQYCKPGYRLSTGWKFPIVIKKMPRFRALEKYKPFLDADMTIGSSNIVNLATQTWHNRI